MHRNGPFSLRRFQFMMTWLRTMSVLRSIAPPVTPWLKYGWDLLRDKVTPILLRGSYTQVYA